MTQTRSFPDVPESVSAARRFVAEALVGVPADVLESVQLMVSELATNCVRHAHTAFDLAVVHTLEQIRVEVTDSDGGKPTMRSPRPDEPTGRGLQIVNLLSDGWGVERRTTAGKTVWFTIPGIPGVPR